jgi:hypothetical protein
MESNGMTSFSLERYKEVRRILFYCSPTRFLTFVISDNWELITSQSIYRFSKINGLVVAYYKIKGGNGKNIFGKFSSDNEDFFQLFLLFFENESFRRRILKIIEANKRKNKFLEIFEELNNFYSLKIKSIKKQDFEQAAISREDEQKSLDEMEKQLKELFGNNFKEVMDYIIYHLDDMINILKVNQSADTKADDVKG